MLGWEFPPHISGGLGTACEGLTRGLASAGVHTTFLMPRVFEGGTADWLDLRGAHGVRVARVGSERADPSPEEGGDVRTAPTARPAAADDGASSVRAAESTAPTAELEVLAFDSPLTPYETASAYASRLSARLGDALGIDSAQLEPGEHESWAFEASSWSDLAQRIAEAVRAGFDADQDMLSFEGGYGPGLFDEVARFALAAGLVAREGGFDLVHAHDWMTYAAGVAAAKVAGVPLVCHLHASEYDRTGDHPDGRVLALEHLGIGACDRLVCVSHYTASIARKRYGAEPAKIRVVHNAVTQKQQRAEWHHERTVEDPIVLFLGRITFQKGPDYFVEAAAKVVAERPRTRFVVSGSGDMYPEIVLRSSRLGLMENLFFTGFLRGKDVERMYAMADLYVMPSVSEPFGITPLEAMALDVPVIVSRQSGVSEILSNALKVDFWDTDELANKILAALEYAPLRTHLIETGRDEVRRMRWELRGELVRDIYRELVA